MLSLFLCSKTERRADITSVGKKPQDTLSKSSPFKNRIYNIPQHYGYHIQNNIVHVEASQLAKKLKQLYKKYAEQSREKYFKKRTIFFKCGRKQKAEWNKGEYISE